MHTCFSTYKHLWWHESLRVIIRVSPLSSADVTDKVCKVVTYCSRQLRLIYDWQPVRNRWRDIKYTQTRRTGQDSVVFFCCVFSHQCPSWRGDVSPTYPALPLSVVSAPSPGNERRVESFYLKTKINTTSPEWAVPLYWTSDQRWFAVWTHREKWVFAIRWLLTTLHLLKSW